MRSDFEEVSDGERAEDENYDDIYTFKVIEDDKTDEDDDKEETRRTTTRKTTRTAKRTTGSSFNFTPGIVPETYSELLMHMEANRRCVILGPTQEE
jgi:hypothetical protein